MNYQIKSIPTLKKILWLDFILGSSTGVLGLAFASLLTGLLGLSSNLILSISAITLLYSVVAFTLVRQKTISIPLLRTLVYANWAWALISIVILSFHFGHAAILGKIFLALQIVVVGGLAYFEGDQIKKV